MGVFFLGVIKQGGCVFERVGALPGRFLYIYVPTFHIYFFE